MLSIPCIIEAEQKLRTGMTAHVRSLFKEPRSSEFNLDVTTNEEAYCIASKLNEFSTPEGKYAAEHFSEMIYLLLGISNPLNPPKPIAELCDIEFVKTHELNCPQFIWIRFIDDDNFIVHTHTLSGFSSEDMSLKEIAIFYDIISNLNESN
jgi:hypothetical protein